MPANCCVAGCTNRQRNSKIPFYNIPRGKTPFERNRRLLWLKAIPRDKWSSKTLANARICGAHFVSGKRSDDIMAPNFVPTIFPDVDEQQQQTNAMSISEVEKKPGLQQLSLNTPTTNNNNDELDGDDEAKEESMEEMNDGNVDKADDDQAINDDGHSKVKLEENISNEPQCDHKGCNMTVDVRSELRRKFRRRSYDEQSIYLVSCMHLQESRFTYSLQVGEEVFPVCLRTLCETFNQSLTRFKVLRQWVVKGLSLATIRGKRKNGRKEKRCPVKVQAREHIGSFPVYENHFGRGVYLNPNLSTRTMHSLYGQKFSPITIKYYRNVFGSEYQLGFGQPRSDRCATCDELFVELQAARTEEEMSEIAVRSVIHHYREDETYRVVAEDVETAKRDPDVVVVCGDLQQALLAPQLTQCPTEFYRRQLSCYNYGVHDGGSGHATMMLWDETVAKRGSAEIASCVLKYVAQAVQPLAPRRQRKLIFWCDHRVGHDGNWQVLRALNNLLRQNVFTSVEQKFLRTGHSFLPCDRDFAFIEKRRRVSPVMVPSDWVNVIGSDHRGKRLRVISMQQSDFKDFGKAEDFLKEPEAVKIGAASWIRLTAEEPTVVLTRSSHSASEAWKPFELVAGSLQAMNLRPAYSEALAVDAAKLADLLGMCEYMTPQQAEFYRMLKARDDRGGDDQD